MNRWIIVLSAVVVGITATVGHAEDWSQWRGPGQNGTSNETGLIDRFDPKGGEASNVIWKSEIAAGISTPITMNGRVYTIVRDSPGTPKDREKVICLDAETGELLWENIYNVFLSDLPAERVGWSNVSGDPSSGNVYAQGACCYFQCIDGKTGKTIWSRSLSEEYGMLSTYGGRTNTPVLFENLVIISGVTTGWDESAKPAHRFFAFDKVDGRLVWTQSTNPFPEDTTFSTPVVTVIDGKQVMIAGSGDGNLYGMQPRTGTILWREPVSRRGVNTSAVFDHEHRIYIGHGEENPSGTAMGAVVCIDGKAASLSAPSAQRWRTEELMVGKSSPLLLSGRLYVVEDSSALHVLDAETGEEIGKRMKLGTSMRGSLVAADGLIYACTGSGMFHVLRPTDDGVESVFKVRLPSGHDVGGSPAISNGRIYLGTTGGLFCLGDPAAKNLQAEPVSQSQVSQEQPAGTQLAQLQVVPAEVIVAPGGSITFQVIGFDRDGRRLANQPTELTLEVPGDGAIDDSLTFVAGKDASHTAATVSFRSGDVQGTARVRVIGALPWKFDFADRQVPITWIGARYRHEPRDLDGEPMIVKISTIPKGTRSQSWFGPTDLHDYTVTADVRSGAGEKLPDMGVIGQRYTLDLMGESQKLQVRSWAAQLRMAQSAPYVWDRGRWYTVKLRVANQADGTALVQGKVWPRDDVEPTQWTVTATDTSPNQMGSPGLFGNATNAEIFIDHVTVTSND
ncbi:MAG: PQQ-like beta-propeller repeat protein [Pirellulaceae bacterium]|nr:PQQ-like beta-propeller repeat protein [Pirellulaceae bacterium]